MEKYDFDEIIPREGTNCMKYDARERFFQTNDVLPLWVADTDFKTPPFIVNAIRKEPIMRFMVTHSGPIPILKR